MNTIISLDMNTIISFNLLVFIWLQLLVLNTWNHFTVFKQMINSK